MANSKTHSWISLWFLVTVPIIAWDVGYCFMRWVYFILFGGRGRADEWLVG